MAALRFQERNRYFERLFTDPELLWMGQNTNHLPTPPAVKAAMIRAIEEEEYHKYCPPCGLSELHELVLQDLGLDGLAVLVTDGGTEALYQLSRELLEPGDEFVTTDPGYLVTNNFARTRGATVIGLPVYRPEQAYRLTPEQLAGAVTPRTKVIYLVDPLNPLGISYDEAAMRAFCEVARKAGAYLIHDCTYRDFADAHQLAARFYPERTFTIYSFSKSCGFAGLRLGAVVAVPALVERLTVAQVNNVGSNVVSQRGAIAALRTKAEWFPALFALERRHQAMIKEAVEAVPGCVAPVYPSQANLLAVDVSRAGVHPEAICTALLEHHILARHAGYHSERFADRFFRVGTTVPTAWVERFCAVFPKVIEALIAVPQAAARARLF
ncbi:MAG: pyridoxal phosphate-dependent aminotransferase [Deltaproteobacteria bacterium]|nr:pyridoxal phosphate-dependent aminotransferase [Deltaproteobacteria bacterium]